MQSLGKVPSARRAPANLPSLKSESSETGAAVPLVPPGGPGWGKQQEGGGSQGGAAPTLQSAPQSSGGASAPTATVATAGQTAPSQQAPGPGTQQQSNSNAPAAHQKPPSLVSSGVTPATGDKLWSSITSGSGATTSFIHFDLYF